MEIIILIMLYYKKCFRISDSMKWKGDPMASRKRKSKKVGILAIIVMIVIVALILIMTPFLKKYSPSKTQADFSEYYGLDEENEMIVVVDNQQSEINGFYIDGHAYVDYDTVHNMMNSRFFWDSTEQVLRYTLPEELISIGVDTSEYMVGKEKKQAEYPICKVQDGVMYMAMDFIEEHTAIRYKYYEDPNRLVVSCEWGNLEYTKVKSKTEVREKGGIKSPILSEVSKGTLVKVLEEGDNWSKVCTEDGFIGYLKNKALGKTQDVVCENTFEEPQYSHITKDFNINLAWHQVTNQSANRTVNDVIAGLKGVNVISPTWFYLDDDKGGIASLASYDYVTTCHSNGIEVWGLVSNLENPDVNTAKVLNTTSSRDNLVNQIIAAAIQYDLDGINVDFESLGNDVGDGFIQFIRELSLKCANNGIVLSVDNYVPSAYTKLYQRGEQARFADYVVLMAYDEHYNGSDEGSVASIGFVKQGVADTLAEVPAEQLVLGIPFYTRIWELTPDETAEAGYTISSEAVSMSEVDTRLAANGAGTEWLDDCGQYYAEYEKDGKTYKIWIEDQNSIEEKLKVYQENGLAGAAFWKLGFEKSSIWDTISKYIVN